MNPSLLQQLRNAVEKDDWVMAADVCLEIDLEARDPLDRTRAEELAKAVRLRQVDSIKDIIDGLGYPAP